MFFVLLVALRLFYMNSTDGKSLETVTSNLRFLKYNAKVRQYKAYLKNLLKISSSTMEAMDH